jgi:alpha-tubulin suppressor-like RCC1 family protein
MGKNSDGECTPPPRLKNVASLAVGMEHVLALKHDGTVVAWGKNQEGQCNVPAGLTAVAAVAAARDHSLALKYDGTVVAWGGNKSEQCNVPKNLSEAAKQVQVPTSRSSPMDDIEDFVSIVVREKRILLVNKHETKCINVELRQTSPNGKVDFPFTGAKPKQEHLLGAESVDSEKFEIVRARYAAAR